MMRITALLVVATVAAGPAFAQDPEPKPVTPRLERLDLQTLTAAVRYRAIENSKGLLTNSQLQDREVIKARVKLDRQGAYAVNVGAATGASITSGWNNTGVGTGDAVLSLHVKQLFLSAAPVNGVELQYGSLAPLRGDGTEITTVDEDAYVAGKRVSVSRPAQWYFDEVAVTQAYLGDAAMPSVFDRYKRLESSNYYQAQVRKKFSKKVSASVDYTRASGVPTWHAATTLAIRTPVFDSVRYEQYVRGGENAAAGFAAIADKRLGRAVNVGGGWVSIDPDFGGLNADRYFHGRRFVATAGVTLSPELAATMFFTRALASERPMTNRTRFDVVLTYNVLKSLQRAGWF
jgi:hypothetical protein